MSDYNVNEILNNIKNEIEKEVNKPQKTVEITTELKDEITVSKSMNECTLLREDMVISQNKTPNMNDEKLNALAKILTYDIIRELNLAHNTQTIYQIIRNGLKTHL